MSEDVESGKVFCKFCGSEIKKDSQFCKNCGKPFKANYIHKNGFWDSIEWNHVIIGSVIGGVISILLIALMVFTGLIRDNILYLIFFLIITLASGLYAGYMVIGDNKKRALNGAIAGAIPLAVISLISCVYVVFLGPTLFFFGYAILSYGITLVILGLVFGAIGGLIGLLINRSIKGDTKTYIGVGFVIALSFSIFTCGSAAQFAIDNQPKHFDNTYVSFDYPGSWKENITSLPEFGSNLNEIANVYDAKNNKTTVGVVKVQIPTNFRSTQSYINAIQTRNSQNRSYKYTTNKSIKLNGINGYEFIYETNYSEPYNVHEIWLDKYPYAYLIAFLAPIDQYDQGQEHFNMILNSFQLKS